MGTSKPSTLRRAITTTIIAAALSSVPISPAHAQCPLAFGPPAYYQSPHGSAVVAADFDGDGRIDLVEAILYDNHLLLFRNVGGGQLAPPQTIPLGATTQIYALLVADVNEDGRLDLIAVGNGASVVLLGNGDGTFQSALPIADAAGTAGLIQDFNGDGHKDLLVAHSGTIAVFPGRGDGTFGPAITTASSCIGFPLLTADFNSDGKLDLVVGACTSLMLGNGDGTFQPAAAFESGVSSPQAPCVGDFNGDGHPDVAILDSGAIDVLLGDGAGHLAYAPAVSWNVSISYSGSSIVADVDGDGHLDIIAPTYNGVAVFLGNGDGTFQRPVIFVATSTSYGAVAAADIAGDGRAGLALVGQRPLAVLLNNSGIGISHHPARATTISGSAVSFSVTGASSSPLNYQWRKDGQPLTDGGPISGARTPTLTLSPVGLPDNGASFDCILSGICGMARSNPAGLAVTARCPADFNGSGDLSIDDVFDYLNAWFAGCP